jgi:hypothetical protein
MFGSLCNVADRIKFHEPTDDNFTSFASTPIAQSSVEAMLNYTPTDGSAIYSTIFADINGPISWTFEPTTDMDVTTLGAFNYIVPHGGVEVGLWDSSGDLLASEMITPASLLVDQTLYQSITPVALTADEIYYLAAYSTAGSLQAIVVTPDSAPNGFATMSPDIQLGEVAYNPNSGFAFPSTVDGDPGDAIIAPNFEYVATPEPTTLALAGAGSLVFLFRYRRH